MSEFKRIPPEQAQALREQGAVVVDIRDKRLKAKVVKPVFVRNGKSLLEFST